MLLTAFTAFHVLLSLVGIAAGIITIYGWTQAKSFARATTVFLLTTIATNVTGFFFPFHKFLPSHALAILSLVLLGLAWAARPSWRRTFIVASTLALYVNIFVLIAQLFQKVPFLKVFAPTQTEPPFLAAELLSLILVAAAGTFAILKFRPTVNSSARA